MAENGSRSVLEQPVALNLTIVVSEVFQEKSTKKDMLIATVLHN